MSDSVSDPIEIQFPLSSKTRVYVEIHGELPTGVALRMLMIKLETCLSDIVGPTHKAEKSKALARPKNNHKRIPDDIREQIVRRHESNERTCEIANSLNLSWHTVKNFLVRHKEKIKKETIA